VVELVKFVQVFVAWLDMVTYLHHHGHEDKLPWYRGKVSIIINISDLQFLNASW
jgi:hypothetical protein